MSFQKLNFRRALAATALFVLSACGTAPPALPPPPAISPNGGVGTGGLCGAVPAASPVIPTNTPITGTLSGNSSINNNGISFLLSYQAPPNTTIGTQNVVGTGTITIPAILPQAVLASSQISTYCIASADPQGGGVRPGNYAPANPGSPALLQIVFSSLIPTSLAVTPYGGYPGAYFVPGANAGVPGFGSGNARMDVQVGYSCGAYVTPGSRLQGCVDISIQSLGIYANTYSQ